MNTCGRAIVAGHICLDIIPQFDPQARFEAGSLFKPGSLTRVGPVIISTGGAVSNTGLILHRLGVPTLLVAKIGSDVFGQAIRRIVSEFEADLDRGIISDPGEATSYSVIINPPGIDRKFFHCPGANDSFDSRDIAFDRLTEGDLLHFGYPPVMRRIFANHGEELEKIFRLAKQTDITTSLDLCMPEETAESEKTDWLHLLSRTLPFVDIFLPSLDELLFMLDRKGFEQLQQAGGLQDYIKREPAAELISQLGHSLLEMGAKIVLIKLGDCGAYLCSAGVESIVDLGRARPPDYSSWANQELWAPCFRVAVVGTTGAGDSTIAGFLSALLRGLSPVEALTAAVAVGACSVEGPDALSGVPGWEAVQSRIQSGWDRATLCPAPAGWVWSGEDHLWTRMAH